MLTPFGKKVRLLRIDRLMRLNEMAALVGVTPSYLSAVENGKKDATEPLARQIAGALGLGKEDREALEQAALCSRDKISIATGDLNDKQKAVAILLSKNLTSLPEGDLDRINQMLSEAQPPKKQRERQGDDFAPGPG